MAEITQAARDFSADYLRDFAPYADTSLGRIRIREGEHDDNPLVQAFQRAIDHGRKEALEDAAAKETFDSIADWCDETFGHVIPPRIVSRAQEEMDELAAAAEAGDPRAIVEAADVVIVLSRFRGLQAAVDAKMAVNRAREWTLMGDGTGYHVKGPSQ
jgi:hypothetical protein